MQKSGEIDFILEQDGMLYPIEIKKSANPGSKIAETFKLLDKASLKCGQGAVVCMKNNVSAISKDALIVPAWAV